MSEKEGFVTSISMGVSRAGTGKPEPRRARDVMPTALNPSDDGPGVTTEQLERNPDNRSWPSGRFKVDS